MTNFVIIKKNIAIYALNLIKSFKDKKTEKIWNGTVPKRFPPDIAEVARRKLRMLEAAVVLDDLKVPPGNRLEKLSHDRKGQYSIRINDQFRICFIWDDGVKETEIIDYH